MRKFHVTRSSEVLRFQVVNSATQHYHQRPVSSVFLLCHLQCVGFPYRLASILLARWQLQFLTSYADNSVLR